MELHPRRFLARLRMRSRFAGAVRRFLGSDRATFVLRYHAVGRTDEIDYSSRATTVTPERFEAHVRFLVSRYDVIDLDEALRRASEGRPRNGRPGVVITFDDGYRDNHEFVMPILRRHGAVGTVYVVAGAVRPAPALWTARLWQMLARSTGGRGPCPFPVSVDFSDPDPDRRSALDFVRLLRDRPPRAREESLRALGEWLGTGEPEGHAVMLDAGEIREMAAGGITIGAHTMTHPLLPALAPAEAEAEIRESRERLDEITGGPIVHFAYPNPGGGVHHDATVRELVRRCGFRSASTSRGGIVDGAADPFALPRFGINAGYSERSLFHALGERS